MSGSITSGTGSAHNPHSNGHNESNGSDGDKCLQHNMLTYTLLESIATDLHSQHSNKDDQQEFNHGCVRSANDEG